MVPLFCYKKKWREMEAVSCLKAIRVTVKDAYTVSLSQCELMREREKHKNAFENEIANAKIRRGIGGKKKKKKNKKGKL